MGSRIRKDLAHKEWFTTINSKYKKKQKKQWKYEKYVKNIKWQRR